ncbi:MBL fold metallo-hydrolase [Atopobacter phocae]|uniref:MBL fold metallo-hydrolase n=1 Tax=Atopobacter phocae TaxID=136492 RepID=UPI0004719118|nr:MBL fold metallo-hydrolase [Atopobacter phocae]
MELMRLTVGMYDEHCYVLVNDEGEALIFDPGGKPDEIITRLEEEGIKPVAVLLTHTHHDHIGALDEVRDHFNIELYMSPIEEELLLEAGKRAPEHYLKGGQVYNVHGFEFRVEDIPGHSIGHIVFIFDDQQFSISGDVIFRNSVGRSDLPGGNHEQLMAGIYKYLMVLPDDFMFFPGHGEMTTVAKERATNPFLNGATR